MPTQEELLAAARALAEKLKNFLTRMDKADGREDGEIYQLHALPVAEQELKKLHATIGKDPGSSNIQYMELIESCVNELRSGKHAYGINSKTFEKIYLRPTDEEVDEAAMQTLMPNIPPKERPKPVPLLRA